MATQTKKGAIMQQDVYGKITDRIIAALEEGVVPWQKPWNAAEGAPRNLITGKPYRGVNLWLLSHRGGGPFWLTYRQARQIGGYVKKGEKGETVVFWKWQAAKPREDDGRKPGEVSSRDLEGYVIAKSYTVFNATQCELPEKWQAKTIIEDLDTGDTSEIAACEGIVKGMPGRPDITHGGGSAFYRPSADQVTMPARERFPKPEHYYSVLFHELTHSTGHASRLNRAGVVEAVRFGSPNYSKEELVAEMGAAFLCGVAGIENETVDTSAAYIKGWLQKLNDDTRLVVHAAAQAQKAAAHILGEIKTESE